MVTKDLPRHFVDETSARAHLESLLWPTGAVCPRCKGQQVTQLGGKSTRPGVWKCRPCRKPFTVTVGTVFHASHVPLHKFLYAEYLIKKKNTGITIEELKQELGISYSAAYLTRQRILRRLMTW